MGLGALCRPSTLPAIACMGFFALVSGSGTPRRRIAAAGLLLSTALLPLLPWAIRNKMRLGDPVFTTTHGGYTLALANNPNLLPRDPERPARRGLVGRRATGVERGDHRGDAWDDRTPGRSTTAAGRHPMDRRSTPRFFEGLLGSTGGDSGDWRRRPPSIRDRFA